MKDDIKIKGSLTLEKIEYNRVLFRKVIKNNSTSGKVIVPKELIGKEIYVVVKAK